MQGKFGWHKQQILKLYASKFVRTQYFLVLDTDLILVKGISTEDFFQDGKPIFQQEPASVHWEWWLASKKVLKSDVIFVKDTEMMGVTPEILNKDICLELIDEIARRNSAADAGEFLFTNAQTVNWTEYTLYWLFIMEKGIEKTIYSWTNKIMYKGIWIREDFKDPILTSIISLLKQQESFFIVLQSTLQLHPRSIAALLESDSISARMKFYFYTFVMHLAKFAYQITRKTKKLLIR